MKYPGSAPLTTPVQKKFVLKLGATAAEDIDKLIGRERAVGDISYTRAIKKCPAFKILICGHSIFAFKLLVHGLFDEHIFIGVKNSFIPVPPQFVGNKCIAL